MPVRSRRVRSRNLRSRKVRSRRNVRSGGARSRKARGVSRVSFAAKLGAFILQGLDANQEVIWSEKNGFSNKQPQVTGVLPFLHLNINESRFRALLRGSHGNHVNSLTKACNDKNLNTLLEKVSFNCRKQSDNGITGLEDALVSSIKNSWNMRATGRKHLNAVARHMRTQVEKEIIKPPSIVWANGL